MHSSRAAGAGISERACETATRAPPAPSSLRAASTPRDPAARARALVRARDRSLKPDTRIDHRVDDVRQDVADEHQQAVDHQDAKCDGVVALQDRRVAQVAHAVDVEYALDEERAGENQADHVAKA